MWKKNLLLLSLISLPLFSSVPDTDQRDAFDEEQTSSLERIKNNNLTEYRYTNRFGESYSVGENALLFDYKADAALKITASLDVEETHPLAGLFALLETIRPVILVVEPSEEDFAFVSQLIETLFSQLDKTADDAGEALLEQGVREILPLFSNDALTQGQKAALFLVVERFLKNLVE